MADTMQEKMLKLMGIDVDELKALYDSAKMKVDSVDATLTSILARLEAIEEHLMTAVQVKKASDAFVPATIASALLPGDSLDDPIVHDHILDQYPDAT